MSVISSNSTNIKVNSIGGSSSTSLNKLYDYARNHASNNVNSDVINAMDNLNSYKYKVIEEFNFDEDIVSYDYSENMTASATLEAYINYMESTEKQLNEDIKNLEYQYRDAIACSRDISIVRDKNAYKYQELNEKNLEGEEFYNEYLAIEKEIQEEYQKYLEEYEEYKEKLELYNSDLLTIESSAYALRQQKKQLPYMKISESNEYQKYVEENGGKTNLLTVETGVNSSRAISFEWYYNGEKVNNITNINPIEIIEVVKEKNLSQYFSNSYSLLEYYDFLTEDEKMMYSYLFDTSGRDAADEYLEAIKDGLNQRKGQAEAEAFLKSISDENGEINYDAYTTLLSAGKGILDGIETFGEGLNNVLHSDGVMTDNQYAQMYILQEISNLTDNYVEVLAKEIEKKEGKSVAEAFSASMYDDSGNIYLPYAKEVLTGEQYKKLESKMTQDQWNVMDDSYQLGSSFGNMLPSMVASIIVSTVATPAAGSIVGNTLMGFSSAGNAINQKKIEGDDTVKAYIYGAFMGVSETTLGLLLGNIGFLNANAAFSIKGFLSEGVEELIQTYVEAGLNAAMYGEEVDISQLSEEAWKSFVYGVIMSGMTTGGQLGLNIVMNNGKANINNLNDFMSFVSLMNSNNASFSKTEDGTDVFVIDGDVVDSDFVNKVRKIFPNAPIVQQFSDGSSYMFPNNTNNNADNSVVSNSISTAKNIEIKTLSEFNDSMDNITNELSKVDYGRSNPIMYAVEYFKSNARKFLYKDTSSFTGLNEQIMENGLYHFTDAADAILSSGYIKSSNMQDSYGNRKTFFFNGIPDVGAFATNLDSVPIKTTAVRVQPTTELVNDSKLKIRYTDDLAITYDGKFDLSGYAAEKCFFVLAVEDGKLIYKQVSEEVYNNYDTTNMGQAVSEYISNKGNVTAIKNDFLANISLRNTNAKVADSSEVVSVTSQHSSILDNNTAIDSIQNQGDLYNTNNARNTLDAIITKYGSVGRRTLVKYTATGNVEHIPSEFRGTIKNISLSDIKTYLNPDKSNIGIQFFGGVNNTIKTSSLIKEFKSGKDSLGGSQLSLYSKITKLFKTSAEKVELSNLEQTARKYYPNISNSELKTLFKTIEKQGCTFVAAANIIFEQLNYDADLFREKFGFEMYLPDGTLNHDQLILDIYSSLDTQIAIGYKAFEKVKYNSWSEAALNIFGENLSNEEACGKVIVYGSPKGWVTENLSDGSVEIKMYNMREGQTTVVGTPNDIAKKVLGQDLNITSNEQLLEILKENGITANLKSTINPAKLFNVMNSAGSDIWINSYFERHGISLKSESFEITYEQLNELYDSGYSIKVSSSSGKDLNGNPKIVHMTNGKNMGWTSLGNDGPGGHAMTLRGLTPNGDIIVSSWGEHYMIPKEYADKLEYVAVKIADTDSNASGSDSTVINQMNISNDMIRFKNSYGLSEQIVTKINDIKIKNNLSDSDALILYSLELINTGRNVPISTISEVTAGMIARNVQGYTQYGSGLWLSNFNKLTNEQIKVFDELIKEVSSSEINPDELVLKIASSLKGIGFTDDYSGEIYSLAKKLSRNSVDNTNQSTNLMINRFISDIFFGKDAKVYLSNIENIAMEIFGDDLGYIDIINNPNNIEILKHQLNDFETRIVYNYNELCIMKSKYEAYLSTDAWNKYDKSQKIQIAKNAYNDRNVLRNNTQILTIGTNTLPSTGIKAFNSTFESALINKFLTSLSKNIELQEQETLKLYFLENIMKNPNLPETIRQLNDVQSFNTSVFIEKLGIAIEEKSVSSTDIENFYLLLINDSNFDNIISDAARALIKSSCTSNSNVNHIVGIV